MGALFLVLLRVAIGWHFLYEGVQKLESAERGGKPFSAEAYLRYSTGPFAPYFRNIVPDVNSLNKLQLDRLEEGWVADVERIANHYQFDSDQRGKAIEELTKAEAWATIWFHDPGTTESRNKYFHELGEVQKIEQDPGALKTRREWASSKRRDLDTDRRGMIKDLDAHASSLREVVIALATKAQAEVSGPYVVSPTMYYLRRALSFTRLGRPHQLPPTTLEMVNLSTTFGLIAMGFCLMIGLFSRLSSLAGVVFLAQIYLSMPPWPGLPENPLAKGHYMIVNKNLIEMIALLALTCVPTVQWVGLDALLFGWIRRRREHRANERARRARERERERSQSRHAVA